MLLGVYDSSPDMVMKMSALICLKSFITQTMTAKRKAFKKTASLSEEGLSGVRRSLVSSLNRAYGTPTRAMLDEILAIICSCNFPKNAEELLWYLKEGLEALAQSIESKTVPNEAVGAVRTGVQVFKELFARNMTASAQHFQGLVSHLFPALISVWEPITSSLEAAVSSKNRQLVYLSRQLDKLFIYLLAVGGDNHDNSVVEQCVCKLIEKAEIVLTQLKLSEQQRSKDEEMLESLQKNAVVLLNDFSKLIHKSPFSFSNLIGRFAGFSFEVLKMDWREPVIKKAALLVILSFVTEHIYYFEPDYYKNCKLGNKSPNAALQPHCKAKFMEFFNREVFVQEIISLLGLQIMGIDEEEGDNEKTLDAEIESGEAQGIDNTSDKIELPIRSIAVTFSEQLALRVPSLVLPLLLYLTETIMTGSLKDADLRVKNNVLQLVGLLPSIYDKLKRTDIPNIDFFISWVSEQSAQYTFFSRRFAVLLKQWSGFLSPELKMKHFPTLVQLLHHKDFITRYAALRTLCEFIEKDAKGDLNYQAIHDAIAPAIVQVCETVNTPHLVWPLLRTLSTVMERIQEQAGGFEPFKNIQGIDFQKLLSKDDPTIRQGMINVFRTVVVSVPFGAPIPYIFQSALHFLRIILPKIEGTDTVELAFWRFMVKEIPHSLPKDILAGYAQLLTDYQARFVHFEDPSQVAEILAIVDEYFLLLRELPFRYRMLTQPHELPRQVPRPGGQIPKPGVQHPHQEHLSHHVHLRPDHLS